MPVLKHIGAVFRWFRRDDGNSTVEFVILFPLLITIFFSAFEVGFYLTRSVLLERALDINMRDLRLGTLSPMTQEELQRRVCNDAIIFKDCPSAVMIELVRVPTDTWTFPTPNVTCVDRNEEIQPVLSPFTPGGANQLMVVRACVVLNPFFGSTPLVMNLPLDETGGYAIIAASTFVNEP